MSVNGVDKSAIARIKHMSWTTVASWLELAAVYARRFNVRMLRGFVIYELQVDEIRTFVNSKKKVMWIFTALEVWSRLWICFVVGRRNYGNVKRVIFSVTQRSRIKQRFLMTTDGFEMYEWAVKRLLTGVCLYGQVIKKRRENRVVRVERKLIVGTAIDLEEVLFNSEDSSTLNTSFIERHNLSIRQGSAYLSRRSPCHARCTKNLDGHLELLRCYYNFVRPHMALKFGKAIKTPAMQAGLVKKKLSFRDVFTSGAAVFLFVLLMVTAKRRKLD
jgi:IS1 family transposase